jgi:glucose-1-phosphate adenylyltransferase
VGYGDDWTPNMERPDIVNSGITIIGKRADVPPYVRIGRNCVIGPNVRVVPQGTEGIVSGTTIRAVEKEFPYRV